MTPITLEQVTQWAQEHNESFLDVKLDDLNVTFDSIGFGSLDMVEAVMDFEEHFEVEIPDKVLEKSGITGKSTVQAALEKLVEIANA